mgnify:CR=1 FL=1
MVELNYIVALLALLIYVPILFLRIISTRFTSFFMHVHAQKKKDYAVEYLLGVNYFIMMLLFLITNIAASGTLLYTTIMLYILSLLITFSGYYTFYKAQPKTLITKWPFNISRNPTYFFGLVALSSLALLTASPIHAILILLQFILTHHVILAEEAYCSEKYGKEYAAYTKRVRRYL